MTVISTSFSRSPRRSGEPGALGRHAGAHYSSSETITLARCQPHTPPVASAAPPGPEHWTRQLVAAAPYGGETSSRHPLRRQWHPADGQCCSSLPSTRLHSPLDWCNLPRLPQRHMCHRQGPTQHLVSPGTVSRRLRRPLNAEQPDTAQLAFTCQPQSV
jgi:hypothetical protein